MTAIDEKPTIHNGHTESHESTPMTHPIGPEIGDLLDQMAPLGSPAQSVAECAEAVVRRAELLARLIDDGASTTEAQLIAREAREEATKARLLAKRAHHLTGTPLEAAHEPPF